MEQSFEQKLRNGVKMMSSDPFCLARRRPWVNIRNGESLEGFSESVSAFLPVGMEESVQNVTSPPSTRTHSSTMVYQVDGEKDIGRAELCALVLPLLCSCTILHHRLDSALALGQWNKIILAPLGGLQDPDSALLGLFLEFQPPNPSPYLLTQL